MHISAADSKDQPWN